MQDWTASVGSVRGVAVLSALLLLYGCASSHRAAPVSERTPSGAKPAAAAAKAVPSVPPRNTDPRAEFYTVRPGDTLYSIALDNGLDYKDLAAWNNLANPNVIRAGQQLRLKAPASAVVIAPLQTAPMAEGRPVTAGAAPVSGSDDAVKTQPKGIKLPYSDQALAQLSGAPQARFPTPVVAKPEPRADDRPGTGADEDEKVDWGWPVTGKLVSTYNETTNLKGIGIAGKSGQAVAASAPGRVLYSGDGIRGYGKLVIIKHNREFLSVYAHNNQLLVKEGQNVVKGQKIAEMGSSDSDQVKLHFEIRRFGKPVDPMRLLPDNPAQAAADLR